MRDRPLILAVDDEPANLALLRKLLTNQGYDVVEAVDGPSALGAVAAHGPDLVCLDVMMPGLDGIEVCQRLRRQPDQVGLPILLLTALDRPEDKVRGLEAGANDFLTKPFDQSELAARLRSLLRTKALQDRLADLLGKYVSESVAAEALRDPFTVSLGGDRRHVSTLFADVRGYTALAAEHPPEATLELLNRYLTVVSDAVERHGGTVADLLGDGVFAFFGAPVMHSDDPGARRAGGTRGPDRGHAPRDPDDARRPTAGWDRDHERRGHRRQRRLGASDALRGRRRLGQRRRTSAGGSRSGPDPRRRARRTTRCVDVVVMQDLGNLRLDGKSDWVRAFNVITLGRTAVEGPSGPG